MVALHPLDLSSSTRKIPFILRSALIAAPIVLSAAPSQASLIVPFNTFTGPFAPANWTPDNSGAGTSSVNTTTMVLSAPGNTASRGQRLLDLNAVLNSDKPEGAIAFTKGTYSFNWSWTFTDPAIGVSFPFGPVVGVGQVNNLALYNDPTKNPLLPSSYETSGTYTGTVKAGDLFGFGLISSNPSTWQTGIATGTITNFQFIAEYSEVPGPLPLAGAAAGFAWSRRLRRRLKTAQSVV